ncbi:MAG: GNAT family N-acetyltransferase [Aquiluna sp.]|nr:GNAT family N-acetyltransferase [Aquiluna sp.]
MSTKVTHDSENQRYEIYLDSVRIGLMDYVISEKDISLVHTEVNPEHQGKNLAAILLRESLADIRARATHKVIPVCSYTVKYMEKHPDTHDLLKGTIEEAVASCRWPGAN